MSFIDYRQELRDRIIIEVVAVDDETVDVAGIARPLEWARASFKANIINAAGDVVEARYAHKRPPLDPNKRGGNLGTIIRMPRADLLPEDAAAVRVDWLTRHSWIVGTVEKVRRFNKGKVWDLQLSTPDGPCVARCDPTKHAALGDDPEALRGLEVTAYGLFDNPSASEIIRLHPACVVRGRIPLDDPATALARRYAASTLPSQVHYLPRAHRDSFDQALAGDPAMLWALQHSFAYVERIPGGDVPPPTPHMLTARELAEALVLDRLPVETLEAFARCMSNPRAPTWCVAWAAAARDRLDQRSLNVSLPAQSRAITMKRLV